MEIWFSIWFLAYMGNMVFSMYGNMVFSHIWAIWFLGYMGNMVFNIYGNMVFSIYGQYGF